MGLPIADLEGKYEIVAKLKEGGMGAIYKVRHRLLDELRVIKVLRPQHADDDELRLRLAREARAAIQLRHPNVVQIFDFSHDETGGLIVMEYIHGADLTYLLNDPRRPSLPLSLEIARQSLRAIGYLHRQGYVHRDVSPDNLMLTLDVDDEPLVKLIDLGIAKTHDAEQELTVSGSFLGKFRYASPEHFGAKGPDGTEARSDLYTFGLVFYELLTGCYPMAGDSTSQLIAAHLFQPPIDFTDTDPDDKVPEAVRAMVLRALEKKAEDRFADAAEWVQQLEAVQRDFPMSETERLEAGRLGRPPEGWARPVSGQTQWRLSKHFGESGEFGGSPDDGFAVAAPPSEGDPPSGQIALAAAQARAASQGALDVLLAGAEALYQLGQSEQARRQVETILGMDAEHAGALRLQALLDYGKDPLTSPEPVVPLAPPVFSTTGSSATPALAPPPTPKLPPTPEPPPVASIVAFDELLQEDRLVDADRLLQELLATHGDAPPLPDMQKRLKARFQDQLARKVRDLLSEAEKQVDDGHYPDALDRLREAQALAPPIGDLHEELTRGVLDIQRRIEVRERRRQVERVEQRVLRLLRKRRLKEARDELQDAVVELGTHDVLHSLDQILDRAVQERQNELGGEAGRALEQGEYSLAIRCLSEVLELDPENAWVRAQLDRARKLFEESEAEAALRRHEDEERRIDFAALEAMVERGELREAGNMLDILAGRWGAEPAESWRRRLEEEKVTAARRLLDEAEAAKEDGDLFQARLLIAEAGRLDPDDSTIGLFAHMLDAEAQERVEGSPVPLHENSGVLHTIAEIEKLRVEKLPLQAWKALQQAIEHFGERAELVELRKELAEQILEESGGGI